MTRRLGLFLLTALFTWTGTVRAQEADASPRPADDKAIRAVSQALAQAFEKGDADAVAQFWTEEGEYLDADTGKKVRGRAGLAKAYAKFFAKRAEVKAQAKTDNIRFLAKDLAVEEGTFIVKAKLGPADANRFSALYVRQDGRWLIALLKEWDDDTQARDLQDLAWLIGTWESEGADYQARTTYSWADSKKFIRCQYTITTKKEKNGGSSGMQIIGVDPGKGTVRSWTFDAEGGIGEAEWTWDGQRWSIDSAGTLANGVATTALNFLTPHGDDSCTWRSVQRKLDGNGLPDVGPVKIRRVTK